MDKMSLEDIFNDPMFDEMVSEMPKKQARNVDYDIEKFQELIDWIKSHDGKEPEKSNDIKERMLFHRLKGCRERPETINKLLPFDELGLLKQQLSSSKVEIEQPKSLDDILNDSELFEETDKAKSLLDLSRYKRTIRAADTISRRKAASHFERYEPLFKQVQSELASGQRRLKPFTKEKYEKEGNDVRVGNFYVDNGILLMVVRIYDDKGANYPESRDRSHKIHTIYENGTENKSMTLLGFVSNLYDSKRHGRMVTEIISDVMGETSLQERMTKHITTGFIYVVKSLSTNPDVTRYKNLYKIGFAGESVEKRIANAANEATYLYAPVKIMATWEVQNFSARKLETALHHKFADKQVKIDVPTANGGYESPSEWYVVDMDTIIDTVNKIAADLQKQSNHLT